jgi:hypothetical protein
LSLLPIIDPALQAPNGLVPALRHAVSDGCLALM